MKFVAILLNLALFGFTCLVTLTEGPPRDASYIVFSLLLVIIPIFNVVLIFRGGAKEGWLALSPKGKSLEEQKKPPTTSSTNPPQRFTAILANAVLLGFTFWAIIDQYPHPEEVGVLEFELVAISTPILSGVVISFIGRKDGWLGFTMKRKTI